MLSKFNGRHALSGPGQVLMAPEGAPWTLVVQALEALDGLACAITATPPELIEADGSGAHWETLEMVTALASGERVVAVFPGPVTAIRVTLSSGAAHVDLTSV